MQRNILLLGLGLVSVACGSRGSPTGIPVDAAPDSAPGDDVCDGAGRDKIKFTRAESCANDGSFEWCIPDNDPELRATLAAISPTIDCAPGGGRAMCYEPPGLLKCFYPTQFPDQCLSPYGEMTPEVWADTCSIAALPPVAEIVQTILE